jgi:hypothetical protein
MEAPLAIRVKAGLNHRVARRYGEETLDPRARRPRERYGAEGNSSEQVIAGKAEWRLATASRFAARSVCFWQRARRQIFKRSVIRRDD